MAAKELYFYFHGCVFRQKIKEIAFDCEHLTSVWQSAALVEARALPSAVAASLSEAFWRQ